MLHKFILLCVLATSWASAEMLQPPLRFDLKAPVGFEEDTTRNTRSNVITSALIVPIDHFNAQNTETFSMRYMYNEEFFGGDGYPIFILIGGEWTINAGWLQAGNMYQMAREHKGYMFYTEHRYYGQSLPYSVFNATTLSFLSANQALEDLAFFIREMKGQPRFADSKVILYGGSYAGNMAIWFKQRYPDLVAGAVSSSGPILAKADYPEYLEVVHETIVREGGAECAAKIAAGIQTTVDLLNTELGRTQVLANYRLCSPLNVDDPLEMGLFSGMITWSFSWEAQLARPGSIKALCDDLNENVYGTTPLQVIGGFVTAGMTPNTCVQLDYDAYVATYASGTSESIAWYWQTCTEYGFFQTAPRSGTVFDSLRWLDIDFYTDLCQKVFDPSMNTAYVTNAVNQVNALYGGLNPNVENVLNIHGNDDPWRALGVYEQDLSETAPTINVPRASHCFDMQSWLNTDTILMSNAKAEARRLVAAWLHE